MTRRKVSQGKSPWRREGSGDQRPQQEMVLSSHRDVMIVWPICIWEAVNMSSVQWIQKAMWAVSINLEASCAHISFCLWEVVYIYVFNTQVVGRVHRGTLGSDLRSWFLVNFLTTMWMSPICLEHLGSLYFRGGEGRGGSQPKWSIYSSLCSTATHWSGVFQQWASPNSAELSWSALLRAPPNLSSVFIPRESQAIRIKPTQAGEQSKKIGVDVTQNTK